MSHKTDFWSRRATLAGIGVALAGCTGDNNEGEPQPVEDSEPEPDDTSNDQEPVNNSSESEQAGEDESNEQDEEQAPSWNWNDVLEKEQEYNEGTQIHNLAERALEGEEIGPDLSNDIDNWLYEYSHGQGYWDLEHFQNLDLANEEEFLKAVNDALTLPAHVMNSREGRNASEWRTQMGATAEIILEQGHDVDDLQMWGWGNDGHGFNYILSEDHGVFTVDTATDEIGRAGTDPLEDAPYGYDIISRYEDSWIEESSDVNGFKANFIQNFLTNGVYSTSQRVNENAVGYNLELIPDLVDKYEAKDGGEFLWNVHRPAVATSVNRLMRDIEEEEKLIMIDPDSIEDLPDLRKFDNFQEYKSELERYTEVMPVEEYEGEIGL